MANIVTVSQLREFLGVDTDKDAEIGALRESAMEEILHSTGFDWKNAKSIEMFNRAVRIHVWIDYYAVRDASQNTDFLRDCLVGLMNSLQLAAIVEGRSDGI